MSPPDAERACFGFEEVSRTEHRHRIGRVFSDVASRYDLMNDCMSLGLHRLWKRFAVQLARPRRGERVLDLAAGTCDLAALIAPRVGAEGLVLACDRNPRMLSLGRDRMLRRGLVSNLRYVVGAAEDLPCREGVFHLATIAFGLRNMTDRAAALRGVYARLRPGGRLLVLEFSRPRPRFLRPAWRAYCLSCLPRLGAWIAGDGPSYRYLGESVLSFPGAARIAGELERAGFRELRRHALAGGVVTAHLAWKL